MVNDPVVEKVARALAKCSFGTSGDGTEWIGCQPHARAVLAALEDELASASASPALGKDQGQSEASREVEPPDWREELLHQARRVRNFSNPDDVFYAVPVCFIETMDEVSAAPGIEARQGQDAKQLDPKDESPSGAQIAPPEEVGE